MSATTNRQTDGAAPRRAVPARTRAAGVRLPFNERRAQILEVAADFFAEHGVTAQTRQLADRCGISQRLLYRFFPTKEDLLREVYSKEILGPFKAVWVVSLLDRSRPMAERLERFYADYLNSTLTRKWLRLFLHSTLADPDSAPEYVLVIVNRLLQIIVQETAVEKGLPPPDDPVLIQHMGWTLHGAISHYAVRRHLYGGGVDLPESKIVALHVKLFLAGFEDMLAIAKSD